MPEADNVLPRNMSPEVQAALRGVRFIAQHIKDADKDNEVGALSDFMLLSVLKLFGWIFFHYYLFSGWEKLGRRMLSFYFIKTDKMVGQSLSCFSPWNIKADSASLTFQVFQHAKAYEAAITSVQKYVFFLVGSGWIWEG